MPTVAPGVNIVGLRYYLIIEHYREMAVRIPLRVFCDFTPIVAFVVLLFSIERASLNIYMLR